MKKQPLKLTAGVVKKLKTSNQKGEKYFDSDLKGFGVNVFPNGRKVFFVRYGHRNRRRWMTLGELSDKFTAKIARDKADEIKALFVIGEDPAIEKTKKSQIPTFKEWSESYLEEVEIRKKIPRLDRMYLKIAVGRWKSRPIDEIDYNDVKAAMKWVRSDVRQRAEENAKAKEEAKKKAQKKLQKTARGTTKTTKVPTVIASEDIKGVTDDLSALKVYAESTTKVRLKPLEGNFEGNTTANRWLASVRACFQEAWKSDHILSNPAIGVKPYPEAPPRDRRLSDPEMDRILVAIDAEEDPFVKAAFRLLLETGARSSEVRRAKWEDLRLDEQPPRWRIPSPKAGKPQFVPLSTRTVAMLKDLPRVGPFIIPGQDASKPRSDFKRPWKRIKEEAELEGVSIHDIRRTYGARVARSAGLHVASKLLRHADVRVTEKVYCQLDFDELSEANEKAQYEATVVHINEGKKAAGE